MINDPQVREALDHLERAHTNPHREREPEALPRAEKHLLSAVVTALAGQSEEETREKALTEAARTWYAEPTLFLDNFSRVEWGKVVNAIAPILLAPVSARLAQVEAERDRQTAFIAETELAMEYELELYEDRRKKGKAVEGEAPVYQLSRRLVAAESQLAALRKKLQRTIDAEAALKEWEDSVGLGPRHTELRDAIKALLEAE